MIIYKQVKNIIYSDSIQTMSQISYANAKFNKVVLEGTDFKDKEAVTASYGTVKR